MLSEEGGIDKGLGGKVPIPTTMFFFKISFINFWPCGVFVATCRLFSLCGKWGLLPSVLHDLLLL